MRVLFSLLLLTSSIALRAGQVCLSQSQEVIKLEERQEQYLKISPSGNHVLYTSDQQAVLLDLVTKEKTQWSIKDILESEVHSKSSNYGFSRDGTTAWINFQGNAFLLKNFVEQTQTVVALDDPEQFIIGTRQEQDTVLAGSLSKRALEKLSTEAEPSKEEMNMHFHLLELNNATVHSYPFDLSKILEKCGTIHGKQIFNLADDGSVQIEPEQVTIFGPIDDGTTKFRPPLFAREGEGICEWSYDGDVLLLETSQHIILRRLDERQEHVLKKGTIWPDTVNSPSYGILDYNFPRMLDKIPKYFIEYPFILDLSENAEVNRFYHIPSGELRNLQKYYTMVGTEGKLAMKKTEAHRIFVHHPFDIEKSRILLKLDASFLKETFYNDDKTLLFVTTTFGEMFIITAETGLVRRYFLGNAAHFAEISDSGTTFFTRENVNGRNHEYIVRNDYKCVDSSAPLPQDLKEHHSMTNNESLAFLTNLLKNEEAAQKYVHQLKPILWKIFLKQPLIYWDLFFQYPTLRHVPPFEVSWMEDAKIRSQAKKSLLFLLKRQSESHHSNMAHWNFLHFLKPLFGTLEKRKKDFYSEKIAVLISNGAVESTPLFQNVFQSKIFYAIHAHVKSWLGDDYRPVSDITITRKKNGFQSIILSSEPIQGHPSIQTDFGIHYSIVKELTKNIEATKVQGGETILDDFVEWRYEGNGDHHRAHIIIQIQDGYHGHKEVSSKTSPDYDSAKSDQKMAGLVVVDTSLGSWSEKLGENYLSYFEGEGFKFSFLDVPDFHSFLQDKIGGCELDYFLKEGHSSGDEKNAFKYALSSIVLKGIRPPSAPGEVEEVLYLAVPNPKKKNNRLFSNKELGHLLREREKKSCGELTYFNTSCWAHVKARYEIEATNHSPLLLNIPSKSLSDTFLNKKGDAIRELIHSYRKGLDFDGFRKSLQKNPGYRSGKANQYIFPDERQYFDQILQAIAIPLKTEIRVEKKIKGVWERIDNRLMNSEE